MTQTPMNPTTNNPGWWDRMVAGYQRIINSGLARAIFRFFDFFLNGHFILATGKWVALVGARTAVTVLFFASLWVAGESTVHPFMVQIVSLIPFVTTSTLDNLALTAFTWLPEIIVLEAILKTVFFAIDVIKGEKRVWSSIWGGIYLPLTGVFIYIAITTFMSYITTHAADQSNTGMLLFRALMAWIYSVVEMAYPAIYRKMYHADAPAHAAGSASTPATPPVDIEAIVNNALAEQATKSEQVARDLAEQHRQEMANLSQSNNLQRIETQRLLTQIEELKQQIETPQIAGPAVSEAGIVDAVMKQLEARFETFLAQQARVSPAPETLQIAGPAVSEETIVNAVMKHLDARLETFQAQQTRVSEIHETPGAGSPRTRKTSAPSAPEQENGESNEAIIHKHLEKDRSLNHRKLSALTGISESTCYRIRKAWITAHPVVASNPDEVVEDEEDDAAM